MPPSYFEVLRIEHTCIYDGKTIWSQSYPQKDAHFLKILNRFKSFFHKSSLICQLSTNSEQDEEHILTIGWNNYFFNNVWAKQTI